MSCRFCVQHSLVLGGVCAEENRGVGGSVVMFGCRTCLLERSVIGVLARWKARATSFLMQGKASARDSAFTCQI